MTRQFSVKWWDAFKHSRIIGQVNLEFPPIINPKAPITSPKVTSTVDSMQAIGSTSADLKALAKQLLDQASQLEASASHSCYSTDGSCSPVHNEYYGAIFQDAQDPFEESQS